MSSFVTRPPRPVPWIAEISTLCSEAIFRTSGDDFCRLSSSLDVSAPDGEASASSSVFARACPERSEAAVEGACPELCEAPVEGACPELGEAPVEGSGDFTSLAVPIVATTLLTATVSPSLTLISVRMPAAGDGISASTLSVEISNNGSSRSIESPTFLIHRTMVPSAIDSPIWGITTFVILVSCSQFAVRGSRFAVRGSVLHEPFRRRHNLLHIRKKSGFERRCVRHRRIGRGHAHDRCVQILERFLRNDRG